MSAFVENFSRFLVDEIGAVTVDYAVLTAAATGLAIAAANSLEGGMSFMTSIISSELETQGAEDDPLAVVLYKDGFANSSPDWVGASVSNIFGIGSVLGPIEGNPDGGEQVLRRFEFDEPYESVTLEFDLYAMDDLEGDDDGFIYVGNQRIGSVSTVDGNTVFTPVDNLDPSIKVTATVLENNVQLGGAQTTGDGSLDSRVAFSITVDNPDSSLDFGFGSDASEGATNESFAIDNFEVNGRRAPPEDSDDSTA